VSRLALDEVTVRLGGRDVVDGVSLAVDVGGWAALIGPNGAGKTSALRAIAGLVRYSGRVWFGSADAGELSRRERARTVALVPQTPGTPPDMTVREYVLLGRTPHLSYFGVEGRSDRAAAERALARLDLHALAERLVTTLSGGERQRAVLARALAQGAQILLLDEPTTALDLAHQQHVLELVDELRREEGLTVIAALHDLTSAALYAEEVHLLSSGRVVASGAPADVIRSDTLSEHFGARVRVFEHEGELVVAPVRA
jgi:iron complex transport system ATP-binding protein